MQDLQLGGLGRDRSAPHSPPFQLAPLPAAACEAHSPSPVWPPTIAHSFERRSAPRRGSADFGVRLSQGPTQDRDSSNVRRLPPESADTGSAARSDGRGIDQLTGKGLW
jgi:hypothetical protein